MCNKPKDWWSTCFISKFGAKLILERYVRDQWWKFHYFFTDSPYNGICACYSLCFLTFFFVACMLMNYVTCTLFIYNLDNIWIGGKIEVIGCPKCWRNQ